MNPTVLVTGASSGIGNATARLFAGHGWNVVATMRSPPAEPRPESGGEMLVTRLDVRDRDSIERAVEAGIARFGRIDALINNAGFGQYGAFEAIPRERILEQFDVNVFGVMDVTRALLPHFRQNGSGLIINVSSGVGRIALPLVSVYCASKFALEGFSESLACELASQSILVKIVVPQGTVAGTAFGDRSARESAANSVLARYDALARRTRQVFGRTPAGATMSADDVAAVIHAAASDGTRQFRYPVGEDRHGFIKARRELPDNDYIAFMRSTFLPDA